MMEGSLHFSHQFGGDSNLQWNSHLISMFKTSLTRKPIENKHNWFAPINSERCTGRLVIMIRWNLGTRSVRVDAWPEDHEISDAGGGFQATHVCVSACGCVLVPAAAAGGRLSVHMLKRGMCMIWIPTHRENNWCKHWARSDVRQSTTWRCKTTAHIATKGAPPRMI